MKTNLLVIIALSLLFTSCGELRGSDTGANQQEGPNISNLIGGMDTISAGDKKYLIEGTADNGGNSGHNFHLNFKIAEGEEMTFHFFSSNTLNNGVNFLFKKSAGKINMTITLNGSSHTYELTELSGADKVNLDVDIHNDHTDTHILVWDHLGSHGDSEGCTFDNTCIYNTEDFAFDHWLGVGRASGTYWGFSGNKNSILLLEGPREALSDV